MIIVFVRKKPVEGKPILVKDKDKPEEGEREENSVSEQR